MNDLSDVEKLVRASASLDLAEEVLDPDEDLLAKGIIDSLSLVKLVIALEVEFAIEIPEDDLLPENFQTIHSIRRLIARRLSS